MLVTNQGINYVANQNIPSTKAYTEPRYLPSMWTLQWSNNDEWIQNISYLSGMIVTFNTVTYRAKQNILNAGTNPHNNYNEWDLMWNNGDVWIVNLSYKQGMIVSYNGFLYKALQNINNKNMPPNNNISEWHVLADDYLNNNDTEPHNQFEGYFETSIVPSSGYVTGFSGEDENGYWSKVASVKVKEQYFQATMILEFIGGTSGSDNLPSDIGFAEILFRVKQQLPFPSEPYIQLEMISSNNNKKLKATDFKAKLVSVNGSGSTGESYIELYVRVVPPWEQIKFSPNRLSFFDPTKVEVNIYNESDFVQFVTGNLTDCISFDGAPKNELVIKHLATANEQTALLIDVNRDKTKAISVLNNRNEEVFRVIGNGIVNAKKVYAEEFEVKLHALDMWYDHVFSEEYNLMTIKELQAFVIENKHLPDIPSEKEVKENGFELKEMNALLLKKIEELTLYIIQLEKRINGLEESK